MDRRFDPTVKYEDETFNILEIPSSSSALVKKHEDLFSANEDLNFLASDLSLVGKFIRIAYNGVAGYTDLQIQIREIGVNVSLLCDKSANLVWEFQLKSRSVLKKLRTTYQYLIDGMEDVAIVKLQSCAKVAQGMAEAAEQLAAAFEEESKRVEQAHGDTLRTKDSEEKRKEDLQEKKRLYKIKKDKAVVEHTAVEQDLVFHGQQFARADARQTAYETQDEGVFGAIINIFTGQRDKRIGAARQEKERHLQEMSMLRRIRSRALQDIAEFSKQMENCQEESDLTEAAIQSLHNAIGGLKALSNVMRRISSFWTRLEKKCQELGGEEMSDVMETVMKRRKEERAEVWGSIGFKRDAILYYFQWIALGNVCESAYERMKVTQNELYSYLAENFTKDDARRNVRQLAVAFSKELEEEQKDIAKKETEGQREMKALKESFSHTLVRQIMTSEHADIHSVMSMNASSMAVHLYAAKFISDSTNRYIATFGIPDEEKAVKLLRDSTTHITSHPQPVERMKELLEILCKEPAGKFVAEKINKQLSTLQAK